MIFSDITQEYELVGIASARNACTTEGLFTRIEPFLEWILDILDSPPPTPLPITRINNNNSRSTRYVISVAINENNI